MKTLREYLLGDLNYDQTWGLHQPRIDGMFELDAPAEFCQFEREHVPNTEIVGTLAEIIYSRCSYCGSSDDPQSQEFYEEWASNFILELNEEDY
jgi:hypothetical protein